MTKAEIVTEIAKQTGIEKVAVLNVVEKLMEVIKDSLAHGENVYLRGFGSFTVKKTRSQNRPKHQQKYHPHNPGT